MKKIIVNLFSKHYQSFRIALFKSRSNLKRINGELNIVSPTLFEGKGEVTIGNNVTFGFYPSPLFYDRINYIEARKDNAKIVFGNNIFINNGFSLICEKSSITISDDVLIGANVEIIDSDFHEIDPQNRNSGNHKAKPVFISKNVFVGSNVRICKGVTIGENSIIGNGSIVLNDIPANVIAIGNPANVIKNII